jgi:hypothetical protein
MYDGDRAGNRAAGGQQRAQDLAVLLHDLQVAYLQKQNPPAPAPNPASANSPTTATTELRKMVMIGDSLTYGMDKAGIEAADQQYGIEVTAVDAVVGRSLVHKGDGGQEAIEKLKPQIEQADIVYLGFGTNAAESNETYEKALRGAVEEIKAEGAQVVIPKLYSNTKSRDARNEIIQRVTAEEGAVEIDASSVVTLGKDGLHPTDYKPLLNKVLEEVATKVPAKTPSATPAAPATTVTTAPAVTTTTVEVQTGAPDLDIFTIEKARNSYEPYFHNKTTGAIDMNGLNQWIENNLPQVKGEDGIVRYRVSVTNTPDNPANQAGQLTQSDKGDNQ